MGAICGFWAPLPWIAPLGGTFNHGSNDPGVVLSIPVLLGTVREGRHSEHLARYVHGRLKRREGITSSFVDPLLHRFENLRSRALDVEQAPTPEVADFIRQMHAADGFVIVTPEYNHGYPGALKNLIDVTLKPWQRKPFALVACGGLSGGLRAIDALRQVISGVGAVSVPAHLSVPDIQKTFTASGPISNGEDWARRVDRVLDEVIWYAGALKAARAPTATT